MIRSTPLRGYFSVKSLLIFLILILSRMVTSVGELFKVVIFVRGANGKQNLSL